MIHRELENYSHSSLWIIQGQLQIWTEHFTLTVESMILKIRKVRLKNEACHAHFNFDL